MSFKKNYITNIQKFSVHDGPGIRTNVFFKGCRLKCKWCANPEGIIGCRELMYYKRKCHGCQTCISVCPGNALSFTENKVMIQKDSCSKCGLCEESCTWGALSVSGKKMTPEEVFQIVNEDKVFYKTSGGGVTFSGGEPFLHADFIREVALKCKKEGYSIAAETCGLFELRDVLPIIHLFDLLLYDIKIIDEEKHIAYCGESNQIIHQNFSVLLDKVKIIPRIPIIPSVNDTPEDIRQLCEFLLPYKEKIPEVHILPYHTLGFSKYEALQKPYELSSLEAPSRQHMLDIKQKLTDCGFYVVIGG